MGPTRTCIICRTKNDKGDLIRLVSDKDGNVIYDKNQKINTRAIYFCKNKECLKKCENILLKNKFKCKINLDKSKLLEVIKKVDYELGE